MDIPSNPSSSLSFPNGDPSAVREALNAISSPVDAMPDVTDASDWLSEIWEHLAGLFY